MKAIGILVDYEWCSGCRSCELACQMEHGFCPERSGVVITELGPWNLGSERWQHTFVPSFTELCDLCLDRTLRNKPPSCVQHCQADVMRYGSIECLSEDLAKKPRQVLFSLPTPLELPAASADVC
jgi:anaerobic dimethyl sulfoxide reductase subunit B (iron-sulfur subunit)